MSAGYTTLDDLENRLDYALEQGEITEQEAMDEWQQAMYEETVKRQMDESFDENGDPYRDFFGNPW